MLDFSKIGKLNLGYNILYDYIGFIHRFIYYRKFQVEGRKNLPRKRRGDDGFLVICNHENGLMDALGIIWAVAPHKPVFIARGDIFKKDTIGRMLRMLRIMPAFRKRDTGIENLGKNEITFQYAVNVMKEGGSVALFPEAVHQGKHYLDTFKSGFARIAFQYAESTGFQKDLMILPLGLDYSNFYGMQQDLLMTIGEPLHIADLYDLYKESPERARRQLAVRSRAKVEEMMLNISDTDNYDAIDQMCDMYVPVYEKEHKVKDARLRNRLEAKQALNAALRKTDYGRDGSEAGAKVANLIAKAGKYVENLRQMKLNDRIIERANVGGFVARTLLWIVLLPIFVACGIINVIPFAFGRKMSSKAKDQKLAPSIRFGVGIFSFLIWYLLIFAAVWIIFKKFWIAIVALLLMPATLLGYHHARALGGKLINRIRKIRRKGGHDPLYNDTVTLRQDITSGIDQLMG